MFTLGVYVFSEWTVCRKFPNPGFKLLFNRLCEFAYKDVLVVSGTLSFPHKNKVISTGQRGFFLSVGRTKEVRKQGARTRWTKATDREVPWQPERCNIEFVIQSVCDVLWSPSSELHRARQSCGVAAAASGGKHSKSQKVYCRDHLKRYHLGPLGKAFFLPLLLWSRCRSDLRFTPFTNVSTLAVHVTSVPLTFFFLTYNQFLHHCICDVFVGWGWSCGLIKVIKGERQLRLRRPQILKMIERTVLVVRFPPKAKRIIHASRFHAKSMLRHK